MRQFIEFEDSNNCGHREQRKKTRKKKYSEDIRNKSIYIYRWFMMVYDGGEVLNL